MEEEPSTKITPLPEIVNVCERMNGSYLSTLLYVVAVNPVQNINKNGKELTLCKLNCYSGGYLTDVTLWNFDLPIADLTGQWIVFSGFRLKKLANQKFMFVSSVYSKISKYEGLVEGLPYNPAHKHCNLSNVYDERTIP